MAAVASYDQSEYAAHRAVSSLLHPDPLKRGAPRLHRGPWRGLPKLAVAFCSPRRRKRRRRAAGHPRRGRLRTRWKHSLTSSGLLFIRWCARAAPCSSPAGPGPASLTSSARSSRLCQSAPPT
ncbi:unnamed protein product [Phytomonas sp. Hart1]|nr:unnamed protein product [Phytomonas sp. Hart1]|eukprot:CCW72176.1 unnamed protein product [Phytomonas sp. isolate Hart1]